MTDPTDNRPAPKARRPTTLAPKPDGAAEAPLPAGEARVAKVLSRAGLCSRRDAEGWILAGRVAVNGTVIASPALNVGAGDAITVDGYPIDKAERTRLFMFHKTRGLVTTAKDPEGRPTIYDALPEELPRLITIGRLDINTEGLLLLTNDGGLARLLELPSTGWLRRYRVRAKGLIDQPTLDRLAEGVTVEGVDYAGIEAKLDRVQGSNLWLTMGLREGKNREIKRVLEHLGLLVNRLIRISFGPFQLGDLVENAVEEVRTQVLRDQLGPALARAAGVDLDGPATAAVVTREVRQAKADERRAAKAQAPAPTERQRPARDPQAPRQHVSALRADRADSAEGPRRKTRRSETADRKGRAVTVERVTTAVRRPSAAPNRNARRFEAERDDVRGGEQPLRRARAAAVPRDGGDRPFRRPGLDAPAQHAPAQHAPAQRAEGGETRAARTPRQRTVRQADAGHGTMAADARPQRPVRRGEDERPVRGERPSREARPTRDDRPRREERSTGRPPRASFGDDRPRTGRNRQDGSRDERPRSGAPRPARSGGGKPAGSKSGPAKPRFERGQDGASKSGRSATRASTGKPAAGRPAPGLKPAGGSGGRPGGGGRGRPPKT